MSVGKGIYDSLSPSFRYAGFNYDQNVRMMPAMKFVGVGAKSITAYTLAVPSDHFH